MRTIVLDPVVHLPRRLVLAGPKQGCCLFS